MRATRLYIDTGNIKRNIESIRRYIGEDIEIMPIIKCNAYGTYVNKLVETINEFKYVGVALIDEAISLRKNGYKGNILVLYPPLKDDLQDITTYNLTFNGCDINVLEFYDRYTTSSLNIHIEIETGMGRTGIQEHNVIDYIRRLKKLNNIKIDGIFSHLSCSSSDIDFSEKQVNRFERVLNIFKTSNVLYNYTHICNSGALLNFKDKAYNMVRIGLLVYGYYPSKKLKDYIKVYPSMQLKTNISFLKEIEIGDTVGYNKNFIAKRKTKIATIPFGFGDGFIGLETGEAYVIFKNKKAKIVGICMDNMMIDMTDFKDVKVGDEIIIFDNKNLTVEEIADWCNGLCNYEIISSLSDRIARIFI